jgi:glycosyltransferase involved in cell wall biosynthesis
MPPVRALRVLHIGTEQRWRGGENQIRLLIEGSGERVRHAVAYPSASRGLEAFAKMVPTVALRGSVLPSFSDVLRLRRFCRDEQIDIVNAHSGNAHSLAMLLGSTTAAPAIVVHRRVASRIRPGPYSHWKYMTPRVARFVAISGYIEQALIDYGVPRSRISVVHSGVSLAEATPAARAAARAEILARCGLAADCLLLGNASALTKEKGYPILLQALAGLRETTRGSLDFHCLIAGDGPLRADLERQAEALSLGDHISFLGHVDGVTGLLCALDILAMPSEREGLGTLLLDATLAGCAIAASAAGGIPEVIHHQQTGLLSAPGDPHGLAANLHALAADAALRQRLQVAALELVRREFSTEQMVAGNLAVYDAVVGRQGRR